MSPCINPQGGVRYGRAHGNLDITIRQSEQLVRLPLWVGLSATQQGRVVEVLKSALGLFSREV